MGKVGGLGRRVGWWLDGKLGGDVGGKLGLGERKFWVLGVGWGVWLGVLSVRDTGDGMLILFFATFSFCLQVIFSLSS